MDAHQDSALLALEKALRDQTMDPTHLSLSVLRDITKNFSEGQEIGRGGFGAVYKGELRNGTVAVKKLNDLAAIREENFQSEVDLLVRAKHKNTVRFLGYCSDTQRILEHFNGEPVWAEVRRRLLCFEFLRNGSLADYITDPSSGLYWSTRYEIIRGICEGVHYLHQQRIIHMDLKPQNILLGDNMTPKITDFGLSRRFSENQSRVITTNVVGTLEYMAPEFLTSREITLKTDIFSLGVIIMEMLMGCKGRPKVKEVLESWRSGLVTRESHIPLEQVQVCAEIGILCMDDDPHKRPTAWDIILRIFDEEEISNWSARGAQSTSSIAQVRSFIDKIDDELKSMNLYGQPFPPKRLGALEREGETNTEIISYGLTYSELLDVHPLELRFPFEGKEDISCALSLTNKSDQFVCWMILPELTNMFLSENMYGTLMPNSTCAVVITLDEQQERPLNTDTLRIWMITSEREDRHRGLLSTIETDNLRVFPEKQIEDLGGQMHLAMVMARVCPQSAIITPKIIFTTKLQSSEVHTMDVHTTEPWILITENRTQISIWNYLTQAVVMSFQPKETKGWVRKMLDGDFLIFAAKFIPRKQWFVTGDDSGDIRVYSYVTSRKEIKKVSAYFLSPIHSLAVHPTYPFLVTLSADRYDGPIRLWDWDMGWTCVRRIDGGNACTRDTRFKFNPKDTTTFAGGYKTCHVWSIHSFEPSITITPPDKWRSCICDYLYTDSHRQYLITSGDYGDLRVFDLETVLFVHTVELNRQRMKLVACHPTLPIMVAWSFNGERLTVSFWNTVNYRLLKTVWRRNLLGLIVDFAFVGSRRLVIGYSKGIEVLEVDLEALASQQEGCRS